MAAWEESRRLDDAFAPVHRNLSLGYAQAMKDLSKAVASLEKAVKLQSNDPLWYYELDLLYEAAGTPVLRRLELLSRNHQAVAQRDEALTREIVLLTVSGQHDRALELLTNHHFHSWEGSRELYNVYADALLQRGQENLRTRRLAEALSDFDAALVPPANLEVGRSKHDSKAVEIHYRIGSACEALGDKTKARSHYEMAIKQAVESPPEIGFYQGLALGKLGSPEKARPVFEQLVQRGKDQLKSSEEIDYFAKFGARKSERVSKAQAQYLIGLGCLGLNRQSEAEAAFKEALRLHPAHLGAKQQVASLILPR